MSSLAKYIKFLSAAACKKVRTTSTQYQELVNSLFHTRDTRREDVSLPSKE